MHLRMASPVSKWHFFWQSHLKVVDIRDQQALLQPSIVFVYFLLSESCWIFIWTLCCRYCFLSLEMMLKDVPLIRYIMGAHHLCWQDKRLLGDGANVDLP